MRSSFGPTVLVGLASGTATAVLAGRRLAAGDGGGVPEALIGAAAATDTLPLAQALALVALAAWGVLLVTRGRFRRAVAVLAVLAAAGTTLTLLVGRGALVDGVTEALRQGGVEDPDVGLTASYWLALAASLVCLAAAVVAVRAVGSWPEMGRRYDAPAAVAAAPVTPTSDPADLWRALDEGHDPMAGPTP